MAIHTNFTPHDSYLLVVANGTDDSLEDVIHYQTEIAHYAYKHQKNRILCDERGLIYQISISEEFLLGNNLSQYAADLDKIAIVCDPSFMKAAKFFETVTFNIGINIMVTENLEEAEKWILED